jgi:hypothetical protein
MTIVVVSGSLGVLGVLCGKALLLVLRNTVYCGLMPAALTMRV